MTEEDDEPEALALWGGERLAVNRVDHIACAFGINFATGIPVEWQETPGLDAMGCPAQDVTLEIQDQVVDFWHRPIRADLDPRAPGFYSDGYASFADNAESLALELLRSKLTPEQRAQMDREDSIEVRGNKGRVYVLSRAGPKLQREDGATLAEFCYWSLDGHSALPWADSMLCWLLTIESDEAELLSQGNLRWMARPTPEEFESIRADVLDYRKRRGIQGELPYRFQHRPGEELLAPAQILDLALGGVNAVPIPAWNFRPEPSRSKMIWHWLYLIGFGLWLLSVVAYFVSGIWGSVHEMQLTLFPYCISTAIWATAQWREPFS